MAGTDVMWWQKYGTLAQMAQATVALLGFIAILFQINEIRSGNRASTARQIYLGYTELAFKNPEFSAPDYERIKASPQSEQTRYESFVSYFLYACEEALAVFASRPEWRASCDYDVQRHLPFLCEKTTSDPRFLGTYNPNTQSWIKTAMQQAGVVAPGCQLKKS